MYVIVTFADETCDFCVRELYNTCYCYELPAFPKSAPPSSVMLTTQGMLFQ